MSKEFFSREILFFPKILLIALLGTILLVAIDHKNHDFYLGIRYYVSFDDKPDANGYFKDNISITEEDKKQSDEIARGRMLDYYTSLDTYLLKFISLLILVLFIRLFYVAYMWARAMNN